MHPTPGQSQLIRILAQLECYKLAPKPAPNRAQHQACLKQKTPRLYRRAHLLRIAARPEIRF